MSSLFDTIRSAFHDRTARSFRVVGAIIWSLIVASVATLIAEGLLPPDHTLQPILRRFDHLLLAAFAVELILRVATFVPPDLEVFKRPPLGRLRVHLLGRLRYLFRPLMLIDLITVAALVPGLRGLRVLRLLRLLRTVKFFRYGNPFSGLFHAFERDRLLFALAFSFLGLQVTLGGLTLYLIEHRLNPDLASPGDGMWMALVTVTTVGFGDLTPATTLGRVVTGALMVGGIFTLAVFAGVVGYSLLNAVLSIREEQFRMGNYVNHLVVCGYEHGMQLLIDTLVAEYDPELRRIVIFADMERPADLPPEMFWVRGDPTKESELDKVRIGRASAVLVAGARLVTPQVADAVTLLTLFTIRSYLRKRGSSLERHRPLYVVAEILDSENVEHARASGADEVIETRRLGFSLLAHAIEHHGTADTLSKLALHVENSLFTGRLPPGTQAQTFGQLVQTLDLRARGGLVIGVTSADVEHVNPPDNLRVGSDFGVLYLARERLLD